MFEEYEDGFVWKCKGCGLTAEFERSDGFSRCWAELKRRGWRAQRHDLFGWTHNCGRCERAAVEEFMNRKPRAVS